MMKNKFFRELILAIVLIVVFCLVDFMIEREFRLWRNIIIGVPVSIFLFFMNRKKDKGK